jgi:hypothetical protein
MGYRISIVGFALGSQERLAGRVNLNSPDHLSDDLIRLHVQTRNVSEMARISSQQ